MPDKDRTTDKASQGGRDRDVDRDRERDQDMNRSGNRGNTPGRPGESDERNTGYTGGGSPNRKK
jgi:hypothetical protein